MKISDLDSVRAASPLETHLLTSPSEGCVRLRCTVRGRLVIDRFADALQKVAADCVSLRTFFAWKSVRQPMRVVAKSAAIPLEFSDLRGLPKGEKIKLCGLVQSGGDKAFDASRLPLCRVTILQYADEHYHVVCVGHSAVLDVHGAASIIKGILEHHQALQPDPMLLRRLPLGGVDVSAIEYWKSETPDGIDPTVPFIRIGGEVVHDRQLAYSFPRLLGIAQELHMPTHILVAGVWTVLLKRYFNSHEVVFGIAGAPPDNALPCARVLPVSLQIAPEQPFVSIVSKLWEKETGASNYQSALPYWSKHAGPWEVSAVCDSTTLLRDMRWEIGGIHVSGFRVIDEPEVVLLVKSAEDSSVNLRFEYDASRVTDQDIGRIAADIEEIIDQIAIDAEVPVRQLDTLREPNRSVVVTKWGNRLDHSPAIQSITETIVHQVAGSPASVAIIHGDLHLTYREMNDRANRLAHYLIRQNVGPESKVTVLLDRSPELVVATLAVMKAGGACVLLDCNEPLERLKFIFADTASRITVTKTSYLSVLPPMRSRLVCVDAEHAEIASESAENPDCKVHPDNVAYVVYTSGTTGAPKGVLVTYGGLASLAMALCGTLDDANPAVLQLARQSFDVFFRELVLAFGAGGKLCIPLADCAGPSPELVEFMRRSAVTTVMTPASVLAALPDTELPELTTIISGGEACSGALVNRLGTGRKFFNVYGASEATVETTICREPQRWRNPPVGKPHPNTAVFVLDSDMNPVAPGVVGELYIGGAGIARGYLNQPALTAERFLPDPWGGRFGARLYRSGDRMRWLPNGELSYVGRTDNQLKIRGYRVEPDEIEAILDRHPSILKSAVIAAELGSGELGLVAYYVSDGPEIEEALRAYLQTFFPIQMIPTEWVRIQKMPLTLNGKLDRRALPRPSLKTLKGPQSKPETECERLIAEVFAEALGLKEVSTSDNFFDIGGHSLTAAQVTFRISEMFGLDLSLREFFDGPTVAAVAVIVEREGKAAEAPNGLTRDSEAVPKLTRVVENIQ